MDSELRAAVDRGKATRSQVVGSCSSPSSSANSSPPIDRQKTLIYGQWIQWIRHVLVDSPGIQVSLWDRGYAFCQFLNLQLSQLMKSG